MVVVQKLGLLLVVNLTLTGVFAKALLTDVDGGLGHFCALFDNGKIKCWGYGGNGQLGYGTSKNRGDGAYELGENWPYVGLGEEFQVKQIAVGGVHNCALSSLSKVKCWGDNGWRQLGTFEENDLNGQSIGDEAFEIGDAIPYLPVEQDVATEGVITKIVSGQSSSCALFLSGRLKCWGHNYFGTLGIEAMDDWLTYENSTFVKFPKPIADVFTGSSALHVCFTDNESNLYCFGDNTKGALGIGSEVSELGQSVGSISSLQPINLGTESRIADVKLGLNYTCVVFENGLTKCFGQNDYGQLGLGHVNAVGSKPLEMGENLVSVGFLNSRFKSMSMSPYHVCGISILAGKVQCWGDNSYGQLGIGNTETMGDDPVDLEQELFAVDLGVLEVPVKVVTASETSCAILKGRDRANDFKVKCWGRGRNGELAFPGVLEIGSSQEWLGESLPYIDFGQ